MSWGPSIVINCNCQHHTNYIRNVTPQGDYFAHQDLMHATIIFKQAQLVWSKGLLGLWSTHPRCNRWMGDMGRQPGYEVRNNLGETLSSTCAVYSETHSISWRCGCGFLTVVEALQQNKPDIPPLMKASKIRDVLRFWIQWQTYFLTYLLNLLSAVSERNERLLYSRVWHITTKRWKKIEQTRSDHILLLDRRRCRHHGVTSRSSSPSFYVYII